MAKGDVGSQNYAGAAMNAFPNRGSAPYSLPSNMGYQMGGDSGLAGSIQPQMGAGMNPMQGLGPTFPQMLLQMAMQNQQQMFQPRNAGIGMAQRTPQSQRGGFLSRMTNKAKGNMKMAEQ